MPIGVGWVGVGCVQAWVVLLGLCIGVGWVEEWVRSGLGMSGGRELDGGLGESWA